MTAIREAFVLPLIFLTVTLLAGVRLGAGVALAPPVRSSRSSSRRC